MRTKLGEEASEGEIRSWHNSLRYMARVVDSQAIPDDTGVALEYNIPVTNNRIDFIITGLDSKGISNIVMIELKQWQHVQTTEKDGLVVTRYEDGLKETPILVIRWLAMPPCFMISMKPFIRER
ncbi:MAG: hypothetical protein E6544_12825 [Prevotella sp.]|nr:hypothetical protein [Prevotella sp.]